MSFSSPGISDTKIWTISDDAVPALRRARAAGLPVAVSTNGDEGHQRFKLKKLDLTDEIDVHPHEVIGAATDEAVMVGNSLKNDVRGALAIELDAVLLDRHDAHHRR